ncbi:MAG: peptide deformylase [Anaerolineae bacterium]|nr:peptide deformylase [Anaerolineae bacterium]
MALREIITVGDSRLRERARPVQAITPEIRHLAEDMVETMGEAEGVGLAAPQIGELTRIIVIELPEDEDVWGSGKLFVVINPEIVRESREVETGIEGCLSVPGYIGEVERATEVLVRGMDINGKRFRLRPRDYLARVFQHEIDHLDGVLYIDRLTAPEKIWEVQPGTEEMVEAEMQSAEAVSI